MKKVGLLLVIVCCCFFVTGCGKEKSVLEDITIYSDTDSGNSNGLDYTIKKVSNNCFVFNNCSDDDEKITVELNIKSDISQVDYKIKTNNKYTRVDGQKKYIKADIKDGSLILSIAE